MSDETSIPLPHPTALSQAHWDGCREGVLRVQRCGDCGEIVFIPQPVCTRCQSDALAWTQSSGHGRVYSYTIVHRPPRPEFAVPYAIAIIELEEGWHMLSNLVECAPEVVSVGMPVEVVFRAMSDEITLPFFRPRQLGTHSERRARARIAEIRRTGGRRPGPRCRA